MVQSLCVDRVNVSPQLARKLAISGTARYGDKGDKEKSHRYSFTRSVPVEWTPFLRQPVNP